jgi:hypothetical protein
MSTFSEMVVTLKSALTYTLSETVVTLKGTLTSTFSETVAWSFEVDFYKIFVNETDYWQ